MGAKANIEDFRLIKLGEVVRLTTLSKPSIYRMTAAGKFPKPLRTGEGRIAWRESEVREWLERLEPSGRGDG